MKKILIFLLVVTTTVLYGEELDFGLSIIYTKSTGQSASTLKNKLRLYKEKLQDEIDDYDWETQELDMDYDKIQTSIKITIESEESEYKFRGLINISSGIISDSRLDIPSKMDIYHKEKDITFKLNYDSEPNMDDNDPDRVENLIKFYINLILTENYDRLSYVDRDDFRLGGDYFKNKLIDFESTISGSSARNSWDKRLKIIQQYVQNSNENERRLVACYYNAKYFYNNGEKKRARLFVKYIARYLKQLEQEDQEEFFRNYFFGIGDIFNLEEDRKYLNILKDMDPKHLRIYRSKKYKKLKK